MPPEAHAVPLAAQGQPRLPDPERLLRAFLDAVADMLPRSPAAEAVTGGPAYAAPEPQRLPALRAWADDVAAGHDAGVRLSVRVEAPGLDDAGQQDDAPVRFRAVLQVHGVSGAADVLDAAALWTGPGDVHASVAPRARADTRGNRWTVPGEGVQLRLGRDGRWWPYRDEAGQWVPAGEPDDDPATALAAARFGAESEEADDL
jgi:hypothetical protein